MTVFATAAEVAERVPSGYGTVEPIDDTQCYLHTGGNSVEELVIGLTMLGFDFTVDGPAELVSFLRTLSDRFSRATRG